MSAQLLSHVKLCDTMDCSLQAPLSMGFSRQEYWRELLLPSPGHFTDPGIEHKSFMSPDLPGRFFTTEWPGKPINRTDVIIKTRLSDSKNYPYKFIENVNTIFFCIEGKCFCNYEWDILFIKGWIKVVW